MQTSWISPGLVALTVLASAPALAQVSAEEAARLGKDLTPVGAERAANKDGTIPEWLGEKAFKPSQMQLTRDGLESLRQRLVKDIERMIGSPEVIRDVIVQFQAIADAQPAARNAVIAEYKEMITGDARFKADADRVLQGRGKSVDGLFQQLERGQIKLADTADDVAAVVEDMQKRGGDALSRLVQVFDASAVLRIAALVEDDKAAIAASDLLLKYMPDYVLDFMDFQVPGATTADLLRPKYVITAANMEQHADKLTEGHKAMFRNYPDTYKMVVYPTVRNAFFPQEIYEATIANATRASLTGTDDVKGAELGFPFPIPKSGAEPIWNHKLKFRGSAVQRYNNQAIVRPNGNFTITKLVEDVKFKYANLAERAAPGNRIIAYYLSENLSPPRVAGQITLVHEQIGPGTTARNAWLFSPGLGRVNRAPDVGFDNPAIGSDGEQFYDQVDVFNGALERYDWKLVGKREMLIPYNSFIINSPTFKYRDLIRPGHINQDVARYELHRVWVVEATLRQGQRHQAAKRVFYVDEDSWSIASVDLYDGRGQLWKVQEAHLITLPFIPTVSGIPEIIYDLQTKRYFLTTMTNEDPVSDWEIGFDDRQFTPAALQRRARTR